MTIFRTRFRALMAEVAVILCARTASRFFACSCAGFQEGLHVRVCRFSMALETNPGKFAGASGMMIVIHVCKLSKLMLQIFD